MNYRIITFIIGWVLNFEAVFMAPAAVVALIYRERAGVSLLITMALCLLCGVLLIKGGIKNKAMYAREGFVAVALCWIVLSVFGALPFVISGSIPSYIDALFEVVSGFTTTGSSILAEVEPVVVKAKRLTLTGRFVPLFKAAAVIAIILSLGNVAQHSFSGDDGSVLATDTIGKQVTAPSVAISNDTKADQVLADSLARINHKVQVINE